MDSVQETKYSNYQGIIPFLFLCFFTLGIFQLYFFYNSWKAIDDGQNNKISPAIKSIFYIIFNFYLVESYLTLTKKTSLLYSLFFHLIVLLNSCFNLLNMVDEGNLIFFTLSNIVLIPILNLRNSYFNKTKENIKKRKWLSKDDVRFIVWVWIIFIVLISIELIFSN
tara:strand:+ start:2651 stop:3151 length:501 start_codon:yes stop_codon:yes gene_type:complete